ncbi:MAG: PD-(D/E)XK nuclease family protein [Anaerolineales bacterium]|nr:PD-(D/E)XK nuclease family protein [Anaerolineales bacterium]
MTEDPFADVEDFIRQRFEENFQQLTLESGHTLTADVKETALQQVLLYWRKLRHVAERVTDTEVRLSLPNQTSPQGREFTIEGVVDIVRADDQTVMYDIKTHDADYVRANLELYKQQLNVYAHIWQELRGEPLDGMAVIATDFPHAVKDALANPDPLALPAALEAWQPLVPIEYDPAHKDRTLYAFGETVDKIESGEFAPPPLERLNETIPGALTHERFGTRICRQCDARFSCASYRQYARGSRQVGERRMTYFTDDQPDQELWRDAGLSG